MTRHAYSFMLVLFAIVMLAACVPVVIPDAPTPTATRSLISSLSSTATATSQPYPPPPTSAPLHTGYDLARMTPTVAPFGPHVLKRSPGAERIFERRPAVSLTFDREMDPASVADALTVEPDVSFNLRWEAEKLYVDLLEPLAPGGVYTFRLARTAADVHGAPLAEDYRWAYRLSDLVSSHSGPTTSNPNAPLTVHFYYSVNMPSVEQALTLQPAITGTVKWDPTGNEDGHYHEKTMASTTRSTALALEAFVRINPDHELEPGIVRYLMSQRKQNGWGSTNETSFTILALTDHLLAKEAATADTEYSVELGGQMIASGTLGQGEPAASLEIPASRLQSGVNRLRLRQSGAGQLYYVISSRMYVAQSEIEAAGKVQITRAYLDAKTGRSISGTVAPGQLVQVQLSVTMPDDGFYMIVEDKLPGGLEALNEGLNTTSHEGTAYGYCYDYSNCEGYRWREYGYNNKEVHGDRVSFFITELSNGRHSFTYFARATRAGAFVALPAEAYAMYDLTVWGRSASAVFAVEEER